MKNNKICFLISLFFICYASSVNSLDCMDQKQKPKLIKKEQFSLTNCCFTAGFICSLFVISGVYVLGCKIGLYECIK